MTNRIRERDGEVADAVRSLYATYPDAQSFDRHLHPDITIWESDQPGPWMGLTELAELRTQRRVLSAGSETPRLSVERLLVDRWGGEPGGAAVARYVLRADTAESIVEFRVTDVWNRGPDGWQIVHHHAEQI